MNSNHLQVGMCYDSFKNLYSSPVVDLSEGLLRFVLPIDKCTTEEFKNLKNSSFTLSFKTIQMLSFFTFTTGDLAYEAPYNPFLRDPELQNSYTPDEGIPLMLLIVNTRTGELKHIRFCGMGHQFTVNLKRIIEKQKEKWKFHYTEKTFNQYLNAYYQIPFKTAINMHGEQQIQYTLQV